MGRTVVFLVLLLGIHSSIAADILNVPTDFTHIQNALDAATEGDEIVVSPGVYTENLTFPGIDLTLRSVEPTSPTIVQQTIIDGDGSGSVITLSGSETAATLISGLTIAGGETETEGGGISGNGSLATVTCNVITENHADFGGGISQCHGLIKRNTIKDNGAYSEGGGIYDCDGEILENVVSTNTVHQYQTRDEATYGGGLSRCDGVMSNNLIIENECLGQRGLIHPLSHSGGGGLAHCTGTISRNLILRNVAVGDSDSKINGDGGGLYWCDGLIQYNTIKGNYTGGTGGGGSLLLGVIMSNRFVENHANLGGGLFATTCSVYSNVLAYNSADSFGGGATCNGVVFVNNSMFANQAGDFAGGLHGGGNDVMNCVIWGNSSPEDPQVFLFDTNISYCSIQDWESGGLGNLSLDPQFIDPENGNFELKPTSPLIDAGRYVEDVEYDILGRPRPILSTDGSRGDGSGFDIGAYEYQDIRIAEPTVGWMLY